VINPTAPDINVLPTTPFFMSTVQWYFDYVGEKHNETSMNMMIKNGDLWQHDDLWGRGTMFGPGFPNLIAAVGDVSVTPPTFVTFPPSRRGPLGFLMDYPNATIRMDLASAQWPVAYECNQLGNQVFWKISMGINVLLAAFSLWFIFDTFKEGRGFSLQVATFFLEGLCASICRTIQNNNSPQWNQVPVNGFVFVSLTEWLQEPFSLSSTVVSIVIWFKTVIQMTPKQVKVFNMIAVLATLACFACLVWVSTITGLYPWKYAPNTGMKTFPQMWRMVSGVFATVQLCLVGAFVCTTILAL